MQVQAQLNRIGKLADNSRYIGRYGRLRRAIAAVERDRDYKVLGGQNLSVVTNNQLKKIDNAVTVKGRSHAIQRAASGGSAG